MRLITFIIFSTGIGLTSVSSGSTFIGNGGSAGDVEMAVTHQQLKTVFADLPDRDSKTRELCECTGEFENHAICDQLKKLSKVQVAFCTEQLLHRSDELGRLLSRVQTKWTNDFIEVKEGGVTRAADAVANRDKNEVTININRFLQMKSFERVFLMTHELLHFSMYDGKPLTDEGAIGPFSGVNGARDFINAMAAATAMEAVDNGLISAYQRSLKRPQGWKHNWATFEGGRSQTERSVGSSFANNEFTNSGAHYRYHFSNGFGIMAGLRTARAGKTILSQTKIDEQVQSLGVGLAYRFFPFQDPLSFLGQSHVVLHAMVENVSVKYSYRDDFSSVEDSTSVIGEKLGCSFYMPMFWGFWLSLGGNYEIQSYQLSKAGVKYDTNKLSSSMGVSYGF